MDQEGDFRFSGIFPCTSVRLQGLGSFLLVAAEGGGSGDGGGGVLTSQEPAN